MGLGFGMHEKEGDDSSPPSKLRKLDEDEDAPRSKPGPMNDKDVPRLLGLVPKLPEGAWDRWGSQAVYFVGISRDLPDFGGLSIYAIDPTDKCLPVYHVFDFTYPYEYGRVISDLSCAIVGSSAYVSGNETSLWVRQIGDKDEGWVEGPQFSRDRRSPELFSLGGRLYALRHFGECDLGRRSDKDYPDALEVLVNGSWRSLHAPPPCFVAYVNDTGCFEEYDIVGWSCVGDSTMIVHIDNFPSDRHRFFRFHLIDDFRGTWTELGVFTPPSPILYRGFTYSSHLCSDDPLLLPVFPRGAILPIFGLAAAEPARDNSLYLDVGEDIPFPWGLFRPKYRRSFWHIISLGHNRYCAIAFDCVCRLDPTIFTFDLQLAGPETASLKNVCVAHHVFGQQESMDRLSGKAYSC